jgi:hypothetical protein
MRLAMPLGADAKGFIGVLVKVIETMCLRTNAQASPERNGVATCRKKRFVLLRPDPTY